MPFPESFATARLGGTRTEVQLGYGFHTSLWGRGLATEVAKVYERDMDHEGVPHLLYRSPGHFEVS